MKNNIYFSDTKVKTLHSLIDNSLSENDLVGSLTGNKDYISDSLEMKWGYYYDLKRTQIIYWGYESENLLLGLAGSEHNLNVEKGKVQGRAFSHSLALAMTNWFYRNIEDGLPNPTKDSFIPTKDYKKMDEYDIANAVYLATNQMSGETLRFQFLAKVLHRSYWKEGYRDSEFRNIILATPLYVSIL